MVVERRLVVRRIAVQEHSVLSSAAHVVRRGNAERRGERIGPRGEMNVGGAVHVARGGTSDGHNGDFLAQAALDSVVALRLAALLHMRAQRGVALHGGATVHHEHERGGGGVFGGFEELEEGGLEGRFPKVEQRERGLHGVDGHGVPQQLVAVVDFGTRGFWKKGTDEAEKRGAGSVGDDDGLVARSAGMNLGHRMVAQDVDIVLDALEAGEMLLV